MVTLSSMPVLSVVQSQPLFRGTAEPSPPVASLSPVAPGTYLVRVGGFTSVQALSGLAYRGSGRYDEAAALDRAARLSRLMAIAPASNSARGRDAPLVLVDQYWS